MYKFQQHRSSVPLLLLGAGLVQACTANQHHPVAAVQAASPKVIAQADDGFVIRTIPPRAARPAAAPSPAVTGSVILGSAVHFDRRALAPTQQKETPHGETR